MVNGVCNKSALRFVSRLQDGAGVAIEITFIRDDIDVIFPLEKEDIELVEENNSVYICLNIDRLCKMNRARFLVHGDSPSYLYDKYKSFEGFFNDYFQSRVERCIREDFKDFIKGNDNPYMFNSYCMVLEYLLNKTNYSIDLDTSTESDVFKSVIQYVIDNHMIDDIISYMEDLTYRFLYESLEKCTNSKNVFSLSKDSYYKNGLLGVVKIDFKSLKVIVFDGDSIVNKITFNKNSPNVCIDDMEYYMRESYRLGEIIRNSIRICKESGYNTYLGRVNRDGILSCGQFKLYACWWVR